MFLLLINWRLIFDTMGYSHPEYRVEILRGHVVAKFDLKI